ncbi:CBS domain-containing protein [Lichenifustis flavocetrariae]|uniref:CBS domain-containing protein n=1 Tax=Lichenifustis flavocetrariae TaxID=2949735 RepID=A0AA41Z324_9HYPH|nr:CBS domain-containing protein [Lichenifustis flavocetrariae]MCW6511895.1 CBS domain-containing protein [Lichenifustis flavocetrariae]
MSTEMITVRSDAAIEDAVRIMLASHVSGLPVVDDAGRIVGIVTEGDFLRREELGTERRRPRLLGFLLGPGSLADDYTHSHGRKVCEVMSQEVVTASPDTSIERIVDLMVSKGIKRLPVVRDGVPVGIVARADILRAFAKASPFRWPDPMRDDADILSEILAEFDRERCIPKGAVDVLVRDGQVELRGSISDERERAAVRVAVENVRGVRAIKDHIVWVLPMTGAFELSPEDRKAEDARSASLAKVP